MKQSVNPKVAETYNLKVEKPIYTLIFDMNSVMKMAISADKRVGSNGLQYGMVFQTLIQFKKMLSYKTFDYVYGFYDGELSGYLRYKFYPNYKSTRDKPYDEYDNKSEYEKKIDNYLKKVIDYSKAKKRARKAVKNEVIEETDEESFDRQRSILFCILEELFVRQVICDKVEGDDLIAYYVNNKLPNEKIVIYSGDADLTQLISDDVTVYMPKLKKFITPKNHTECMGYNYKNVALKKILCGDMSDNIKGIKGLGETTLFKIFPEFITEEVSLGELIEEANEIIEERKREKQKPLKVLYNIVNSITDGIQGKNIYKINEKIISLKEPLLTDEAKEEMDAISYAPIDPSGRDYKNVYNMVTENGMTELLDERKFSSFFSSFNPIIEVEKERFEKSLE